jgi:hypothetical protein
MNILTKILSVLLIVVGIIAIAFVFAILLAFPVMWLWNGCLVGLIAGINPITSFWQAFGLMLLCSLLFKSSNFKKS